MIKDVLIQKAPVFTDTRGKFLEFGKQSELKVSFPQTNILPTKFMCGRGIHVSRFPQYKFVTVAQGKALQVLVDFRGYDRVVQTVLLEEGVQVLVPPFVGHGLIALDPVTICLYQSSTEYAPKVEVSYSLKSACLLPFYEGFLRPTDLILSEKDSNTPEIPHGLIDWMV